MGYCNQVMVRAQSEGGLLESVCKNLVEAGGYRMAWVGCADQDHAKKVRPLCHAGFEEGYLAQVRITGANDAWGEGPTGRALRTGLPAVEDGGITIYDSTVINEYLEDRYGPPRLLPADPAARARVRELEQFADEGC